MMILKKKPKNLEEYLEALEYVKNTVTKKNDSVKTKILKDIGHSFITKQGITLHQFEGMMLQQTGYLKTIKNAVEEYYYSAIMALNNGEEQRIAVDEKDSLINMIEDMSRAYSSIRRAVTTLERFC